MNAIIVDDEPLARQLLGEYLADFPQIQVLATCDNSTQAVATLNRQRPELVFLDIQMPGLTGFEVLDRLDYHPGIVFTTAYGEFALPAFEINAIDYLLKPYDRERFAKAVHRALDRAGREDLEAIWGLLQQTADIDSLFVRIDRKMVPVALALK